MTKHQTLTKLFIVLSTAMLLAVGLSRSAPEVQAQTGTVELIGQIGGETKAVFVEGNIAYIGEGFRLTILDISNPADPTVLGQSPVLPDTVQDVYVSGSFAYVANRLYGGLQIINISNPVNPVLTGNYDTPSAAFGVAISGSYAYVADNSSGLQIINISNPANPILSGNYDTSDRALGVAVSGNYAYVADDTSGLQIINISNPANPTLTSSFPGYANDVAVSGNYAYVADDTSGLQIINISNPANPILSGNYDTSDRALGVAVSGNYAYVADDFNTLHIIDISNPANPTLTSYYDISADWADVAVSDNYAYVADGDSGLHIINISNPANPILSGSYDNPGSAYDVAVSGNYAYVVTSSDGLLIINISNPANPTLTGSYDTPGDANDVAVSGNYAYLATNYSGLQVLDISNPANPTLTGSYDTGSYDSPASARAVAVSGSYAYVADGWDGGLQIINISNPANPTLSGSYDTPDVANGVAVSGNYAYVADGSGLQVLDISNPANPTLSGSYDTPGYARGVAVSGSYAYVAHSDGGLQIFNISNPVNLVLTGNYAPDNNLYNANGVAVSGSYAYVGANYSLQIINISNPANPTLSGTFPFRWASGVAISGSYAYVADEAGGLVIVQFDEAQPALSVTPTALTFTATEGGSNPADQSLTISNSGTGSLAWTSMEDSAWFSLDKKVGQTPSNLILSVDITDMVPGTYNATIVINAPGALNNPVAVNVTLVVLHDDGSVAPRLNISKTDTAVQRTGTTTAGNPVIAVGDRITYRITVQNDGTADANNVVITDVLADSLTFVAATGTPNNPNVETTTQADGTTLVTMAFASLPPQSQDIVVTLVTEVDADGAGRTILTNRASVDSDTTDPVSSDLLSTQPDLTDPTQPIINLTMVTPTSLNFTGTEGGSNPASQSLTISNNGSGTLNWTASETISWLSLDQTSGTGDTTVNVSVDITNLIAGTYNGQIIINSVAQGSPKTIEVNLTIDAKPITGLNLTVSNIEVSQAIQTPDNTVPLVANRPAIVRAFVRVQNSASSVSQVTAKLHAARNGVELTNSPITPFNSDGSFDAPINPSRTELDNSLNFQLPANWLSVGEITLWVEVNPDRTVTEGNYNDNRSQDYTMTFTNIPSLDIVLIPIAYQRNGSGAVYRPDMSPKNSYGLGMLQRIYPIPNIRYSTHSEYVFKGDLKTDAGWTKLLKEIANLRSRERTGRSHDAGGMPKYYGVLPMEADFFGGLGYIPGTSSIGLVDQGNVAAHEIGHNLGLPHVDCGNPAGPDPNYPYSNGSIGQIGIDVYQRQLVLDSTYKDLMSYCRPVWVSDYHYRKIFNVLSGQSQRQTSRQVTQSGWLISGRIEPDGSGKLDNTEIISTSYLVAEPGSGLYQLELVDQNGDVQFRYNFNPTEIAVEEAVAMPADFNFVVPTIENLATIQLRQGSNILDTLSASSATPSLDVSQAAGSDGDPNSLTISWELTGSRRQTDQTTINVRYSADNGQTWQMLAVERTDTSLDLSKTQLPASDNGIIEVVALNNTQSEAKRVEIGAVENKPPQVGIVGEDIIQFYPQEPIILEGVAMDLEDGSVVDNNMIWSATTLGQLGSGQTLFMPTGLDTGEYIVNFTATDSNGNSSDDTVTIIVKSEAQKVYLPLIVK